MSEQPVQAREKLLYAFRKIFKWSKASAVLGVVVTTFGARANADLDFSIGANFRSYALSGVLEGEAGENLLLWGNPNSLLYGYLRPRALASTAVTYNSLDGAVEFFPIAFLGARAGGEAVQNDHDYSAYDCKVWQCRGRFYRQYFEAQLSLGAGPVFVQGRWRRERWSAGEANSGDFIDPTSGLLMRQAGDAQTVYYAVAGYKLNPQWTLMAALRLAESDPHDFSRMPFASLRYSQGGLSLGLGAGSFESTLKKAGTMAIAFLRWEISPSLALH